MLLYAAKRMITVDVFISLTELREKSIFGKVEILQELQFVKITPDDIVLYEQF